MTCNFNESKAFYQEIFDLDKKMMKFIGPK